jgi:hypothetical protein
MMVAVGCLILALGCGLGAVAVRQGAIRPPEVQLQLGGVRLVGITSHSPDCTRLLVPGCTRLAQIPTVHIYTLWLFVQREPGSWNQPRVTQLLAFQVGE